MLANDVSLRNLIPAELAKGFGFFQSKPATAFSPVAVTPDELGDAWRGGRLHLDLESTWNGERVGLCNAGEEMTFHFGQLIAHLCKTRNARAGSIVGSGTVSNKDWARGYSCIAEKRAIETIEGGAPKTPFMRFGDTIRIEMKDAGGRVDLRRDRAEGRARCRRADERRAAAALKFATVWLVLGAIVFLGFQWQRARGAEGDLHDRAAASSRSAAATTATTTGRERSTASAVDFLVDTGASGVAIPAALADRLGLRGEGRCARAPPAARSPAASSAPTSRSTAAFAPSGCAWSPCRSSTQPAARHGRARPAALAAARRRAAHRPRPAGRAA